MDTLGRLIDDLITVDMKLWHAQDDVHRCALEDPATFAQRPTDQVHAILKRTAELNLQRNRLMTEIDQIHDRDIQRGKGDVDPRPKVMPR